MNIPECQRGKNVIIDATKNFTRKILIQEILSMTNLNPEEQRILLETMLNKLYNTTLGEGELR